MSSTGVKSLDHAVQTTNEWLKDMKETLHLDSSQEAYQICKAVLHALRDRLSVEEVAQLAAQLPLLLRGAFYDGWVPSGKPEKIKTQAEFFEKVNCALPPGVNTDAQRYSQGVFGVLERRISEGEVDAIKSVLPHALQELWPPRRDKGVREAA